MPNDLDSILKTIEGIKAVAVLPFWQKWEFWISAILSGGGLLFSWLAFGEAGKAKQAATEAGRTVKIQTITIELTEISQKLDNLKPEINFSEARDLLAEITRRLRRVMSPFQSDSELSETITALKETMDSAKDSLRNVRPNDLETEAEAPRVVYYAIEGDLSSINNLVADLLGLFEKKSIESGENNAK